MANRLVMGPLPGGGFGIRASRPGANVLNANLPGKDISFDSRWLEGSRIVISGSTTLQGGNAAWQWFNYGETLSYIPRVFAMRQIVSGNQSGRWIQYGSDQSYSLSGEQWDPDGTEGITDDSWMALYGMRIEASRIGFWRTGVPIVYVVMRG